MCGPMNRKASVLIMGSVHHLHRLTKWHIPTAQHWIRKYTLNIMIPACILSNTEQVVPPVLECGGIIPQFRSYYNIIM